ncbi:DNA-directed RNA polymerase subunit H [Candidatus Woesearchaeota archaeon]|nr:DNA-directed RNA polymerase subunit H [Candidatus Woesearchaeota archaeon]
MTEASQEIRHFLVPEHIRLTDEEKKEVLEKYNISIKQLPMINISDTALKNMSVKVNDLVMIKRSSPTAKETNYYRVVVDG